MKITFIPKVTFLCLCLCLCVLRGTGQGLIVRANDPVIYKTDGTPFLWLGDTAWELFHVLDREEIIRYLNNRQEKGFTVVQAVILSELNGLNSPNAYGDFPLVGNDPKTISEDYFALVDFSVEEAARRDLYMALLPTWGNNVADTPDNPSIFDVDNAYIYGKTLGQRYRGKENIIWILGGDRNVVTDREFTIWQAMARGIRDGNGGEQLMSYHPTGEISSHYWFHNESWLSFNIVQSGHYRKLDPVYRFASMYVQLRPIKPFVNAEPSYEDIPVRFWEYYNYSKYGKKREDVVDERGLVKDTAYFADGIYDAHDIRMQAYWTYLSGAAGYTYGNNAVWQMYKPGGRYNVPCLCFWDEAMDRPGAESMRHVKKLFTHYPLGSFDPDLSVLFGINHLDDSYMASVVAKDHSFVLVYLGVGQEVKINRSKLCAPGKAYWFDPRNGEQCLIGTFENYGVQTFIPPGVMDRAHDWVLILEVDK